MKFSEHFDQIEKVLRPRLIFEYIEERCPIKGDWFFGFLGALHTWTDAKPAKKMKHVYRMAAAPAAKEPQ